MSQLEEVVLERLKVGIAKYITSEMMVDVKPEIWMDACLDSMCVSLHAYIIAEKLQETTQTVTIPLIFSYPSGPWQMFKQKYFPTFLKNIFPVREKMVTKIGTKTVTFTRYATYPKLPIVLPKYSNTLNVIKETIDESDIKEIEIDERDKI